MDIKTAHATIKRHEKLINLSLSDLRSLIHKHYDKIEITPKIVNGEVKLETNIDVVFEAIADKK